VKNDLEVVKLDRLFRIKSAETILRESQKEGHQLKKVLGPVDLIMLGIGAIIGAGIFVITGTAAAGGASHIGAGPAIVLSFIITGIACGFAALCYAEFASLIPIAGSAYTYSYATLGEIVAWIIGWDLILEYMVGSATVAIGWSGYFKSLMEGVFPGLKIPTWLVTDIMTVMEAVKHPERYIEKFQTQLPEVSNQLLTIAHNSAGPERVKGMLDVINNVPAGDLATMPLLTKFQAILLTYQTAPHIGNIPFCFNLPAFMIIALVTILLVVGISESAKVNNFIVGLKLVILCIFIGVGIFHIDPKNWHPFAPNGIQGIQTGAAMIFFAYIGFDAVSTTAEEAKNPGRDLPIGIIGSLVICTVFYVIVSGIMTGICPWNLLGTAEPVATALKYIHQDFMASYIISVGAVVALIAVLIVMMLGQPRIFFSMSRDGFVPKWFSGVHPKFKTPFRTTILTGCIVGLLATFFDINSVGELCNIGTLFAFVLVCGGVALMRHRNSTINTPFDSPAVPWILLVSIIAFEFILVKYWAVPLVRYACVTGFALTLLIAFIMSFLYKGEKKAGSFRAPFVPFVSLMGIVTCIYLMCGLPAISWWRFGVWMAIGLVLYFIYGMRHTKYTEGDSSSVGGDVTEPEGELATPESKHQEGD
jgi:basic amino acid/polyamine antiporter, APA family